MLAEMNFALAGIGGIKKAAHPLMAALFKSSANGLTEILERNCYFIFREIPNT